jgi:hypothetical protein
MAGYDDVDAESTAYNKQFRQALKAVRAAIQKAKGEGQ